MDARYEHLLRKSRDAKTGGEEAWSAQSTGERVSVALVLDHADWLHAMDFTIAEAIDRIGPELLAMIPEVARQLATEG